MTENRLVDNFKSSFRNVFSITSQQRSSVVRYGTLKSIHNRQQTQNSRRPMSSSHQAQPHTVIYGSRLFIRHLFHRIMLNRIRIGQINLFKHCHHNSRPVLIFKSSCTSPQQFFEQYFVSTQIILFRFGGRHVEN